MRAAIFSIIASCRLHSIDPQQYLDEVLRILPYWPRERYLELAPHKTGSTRTKLDPDELNTPLCSFTIPASQPPEQRPRGHKDGLHAAPTNREPALMLHAAGPAGVAQARRSRVRALPEDPALSPSSSQQLVRRTHSWQCPCPRGFLSARRL